MLACPALACLDSLTFNIEPAFAIDREYNGTVVDLDPLHLQKRTYRIVTIYYSDESSTATLHLHDRNEVHQHHKRRRPHHYRMVLFQQQVLNQWGSYLQFSTTQYQTWAYLTFCFKGPELKNVELFLRGYSPSRLNVVIQSPWPDWDYFNLGGNPVDIHEKLESVRYKKFYPNGVLCGSPCYTASVVVWHHMGR